MPTDLWLRGPIGADADQRVTRVGCRTVLVMLPTMTAGTRLLDVVPLFEGDHRVQVVFTVPETTETWHGIHEFAHRHGRLVLPWHQALQHRFDLVLAASYTELERVRGPVVVLPHGATSLMSRKYSRSGGPAAHPHTGLARQTLTHRGRVIPTVLALTHDRELAVLRESCPEALPKAVVAGDICVDRMVASQPLRPTYRRALEVRDDQRLVLVSSTWTPESAFGRHPDLCHRLLMELPSSRHRVALVLHPSVWAVHGRAQIRGWLAPCIRDGLLLIPPEEGWRATAVASDVVIGDHGSTTQYAAAIGRPVVLAAFPGHAVRSGSVADTLAGRAPMLSLDRPIPAQLDAAWCGDHFAELLTARPGRSAAILRHAMYQVLDLVEPAAPAVALPVPAPHPFELA
jgi:hypothetical protein